MSHHTKVLIIALFSCGAAPLAGCSDRLPPVEGQTTHTVGPLGGTVTVADGRLVVNIPAGALDKITEITVTPLDNAALPSGAVPNTGFELLPDGLQFAKAVDLTITYRSADLPQADTTWLRVAQVLPDGRFGATQFVTHSEGEGWVRGKLTHFSAYALADLKIADAIIKNTKQSVNAVDVLFVVDNSGSMAEEQINLAKNFPEFIAELDAVGLDYRVGVISPDLGAGNYTNLPSCEVPGGDGGKLRNTPRVAGCTAPTDPWMQKIAGQTNVPGDDVAAAFSCIAQLGTAGCGYEQPLEAVHKAVDPQTNPGFLRDTAALAVVFITDEDDCSAANAGLFDPTQTALTDPLGPLTSFRCFEFGVTCDINDRNQLGPRANCVPAPSGMLHPIERYVSRLAQVKPNGNVIVSAITGPRAPVVVGQDGNKPMLRESCSSSAGAAVPAIRLAAFIDAFGPRGSLQSICESDFGPALQQLGQLVVQSTQSSWCLPYDPVDTNALTPEIDGDCVVIASKLGKLPACAAGASSPCYALVESPSCGQSKTMIELNNVSADELGDEVYAICLAP